MLEDLSSGFNIITHISQWGDFMGMTGFTRDNVERIDKQVFIVER
jgi:hypothetical protein